MGELTCQACLALCPEVALGAAEAEDRAEVLAHIEGCAPCAAGLRSMTDLGDALAGLVPPIDPPAGFERRVLDAVVGRIPPGLPLARWRRLRSRPLAVAAAAAVAVALALGGWAVGAGTASPGQTVVTAVLRSDHHQVAGQVVLVPGAHPWISMTVALRTRSGEVRCQVRGAGGRMVTIGTFAVVDGYGSWASPLPGGLIARSARLTTPGGRVLASAVLSE